MVYGQCIAQVVLQHTTLALHKRPSSCHCAGATSGLRCPVSYAVRAALLSLSRATPAALRHALAQEPSRPAPRRARLPALKCPSRSAERVRAAERSSAPRAGLFRRAQARARLAAGAGGAARARAGCDGWHGSGAAAVPARRGPRAMLCTHVGGPGAARRAARVRHCGGAGAGPRAARKGHAGRQAEADAEHALVGRDLAHVRHARGLLQWPT